MKRHLLMMILLAIAAVCTIEVRAQVSGTSATSTASTPAATTDAIKEYLLSSAAQDFHDHQPPRPIGFRRVRLGHVGKDEKASYRLCGEFLAADENGKPRWTPFATVKTSGYEQYLGNSTTYCKNAKMVWDTKGDIAQALKNKFDSLR